jgi:hypothetical protein
VFLFFLFFHLSFSSSLMDENCLVVVAVWVGGVGWGEGCSSLHAGSAPVVYKRSRRLPTQTMFPVPARESSLHSWDLFLMLRLAGSATTGCSATVVYAHQLHTQLYVRNYLRYSIQVHKYEVCIMHASATTTRDWFDLFPK